MKEESLQRIWDWLCDRNFLDDGIEQLSKRWSNIAGDFDSLNDQDPETGNSFLHDVVVLYGDADLPQIVGTLIEEGADVNIRNCLGLTPLHRMFSFDSIIYHGCIALEITKILIENGAQAATTDAVGDTPLHCFLRGARYGRIDHFHSGERIVEFLLGDEASPDARNDRAKLPESSCLTGQETAVWMGTNFTTEAAAISTTTKPSVTKASSLGSPCIPRQSPRQQIDWRPV